MRHLAAVEHASLLHLVLELLEGAPDELPQVHHVLDGAVVRPPEGEHDLHEIAERDAALLAEILEDRVRVVHDAHGVHVHLLQGPGDVGVLEDRHELRPGDAVVVVLVQLREDALQLLGHAAHLQRVVLGLGHGADDLAEDADEHVDHREGREDHKDDEDQAGVPLLPAQRLEHGALVRDDALDQERVHGARHAVEVGAPDL
mmetsp:Transcript_64220/g.206878  ORF Transcript_64220/g.206878 Transcript_64220/m.206878 type:complete len:202 (-) Transcript_64220:662-1267(-)